MKIQTSIIPGPAESGHAIIIRALTPEDLGVATALLAHGMRDNPLHVQAFGAEPTYRQQRLVQFLGWLLTAIHTDGKVLGAFAQDEMVGVLGMMAPGRCRPAWIDRLRFARVIMTGSAPAEVFRVLRWLRVWLRNDPNAPHWHIGPLVVAPGWRRRGIGRRLMTQCCDRMDALSATAWLETDLAINAAFYETLGFTLVTQQPVLGVPNWFMIRTPRPQMGPVQTVPGVTDQAPRVKSRPAPPQHFSKHMR